MSRPTSAARGSSAATKPAKPSTGPISSVSSSPNPQAASTSAQIGRTASPARDIPWDIR
jgi:hypothetical protein